MGDERVPLTTADYRGLERTLAESQRKATERAGAAYATRVAMAAQEQERAAVVAWLRKSAAGSRFPIDRALEQAADEIERGEHRG